MGEYFLLRAFDPERTYRFPAFVSDDSFLQRLPASLDQESGFQIVRGREAKPEGINPQVEGVDLKAHQSDSLSWETTRGRPRCLQRDLGLAV
jgi:hypothetical protein